VASATARYIRRTIAAQRALDVAGRLMLTGSSKRPAWWAGTVTLGLAKIIENMEMGHNCHARPVELDERSRDPFHDMEWDNEWGNMSAAFKTKKTPPPQPFFWGRGFFFPTQQNLPGGPPHPPTKSYTNILGMG